MTNLGNSGYGKSVVMRHALERAKVAKKGHPPHGGVAWDVLPALTKQQGWLRGGIIVDDWEWVPCGGRRIGKRLHVVWKCERPTGPGKVSVL